MIKVGIAGADTPEAGELLRLCLHHPDVDIVTAYAPSKAGQPVSAVHHGFIGEERILFTSNFDATALDLAFLIQPLYSETDWVKLMADRPQLKLVLFKDAMSEGMVSAFSPVYGLSEINRKSLVRGARTAMLPGAIASPLLVALYPLARHLMLSGDLKVSVEGPKDLGTPESVRTAAVEIKSILPQIQTSFSGDVSIDVSPSTSDRNLRLSLDLPITTDLQEIFKIYDSVYDDHNFTHLVTHPVTPAEVEGTDKVIISIYKPSSDTLHLDIVADARMRGGAGEAIHIMNLLFNLHEKTGLDLKSSAWKK